ncbi:MAG TPA: ComF family protein [Burkholderiales bacterium]
MREKLASLPLRVTSFLFGGNCFICRGASRALLCTACEADLPCLAAPLCPRCALPTPAAAVCGRCLAEQPAYDATIAAFAYDFPADALVHALKFRGELALAALLGGLLGRRLGNEGVDHVVPVPLAPRRLRERGYNQAVEIARHLGKGAPEVSLCERTRDAAPQMELPYAERQRNVRGSFRCTRELIGARVAVVDDVMTTGATLDEMARTLKRAGAIHVVNWVVARTLPRD